MYRVCWYTTLGELIRSEPMTKAAAEAWAAELNIRYPHIYHWIEEV